MSYSDNLNMLQESSKQSFSVLYEDKPDEELKAIIRHNAMAILTQDAIKAADMLGESKACQAILEKRRANADSIIDRFTAPSDVKKKWREELLPRKRKALAKLKTAAGYHGQLVAAVLEEENGLTASQIRQWSEELTAMEDGDYAELLNNLVLEKVISAKEDRFYLLGICAGDLFPADPWAWIHNICNEKKVSLLDKEIAILKVLIKAGGPISVSDLMDFDREILLTNSVTEKEYRRYISQVNEHMWKLDALVDKGILVKYSLSNKKHTIYYFPMLGEEETK